MDTVQFPRGKSVANRNKILLNGNPFEIVVPISKKSGSNGIFTYNEALFADNKWFIKPLKTIKNAYHKAPYFNNYYDFLVENFQNSSFVTMNVEFIIKVCSELQINTKIILLSEIKSVSNDKNERIIDLCKIFDANVYLSGKGGANYNDGVSFSNNGIKLEYLNLNNSIYSQCKTCGFVSNLSIIDLLFNEGNNAKTFI